MREAVARAQASAGRPVVLADIADNPGGGAPGDTTGILRELLRVGARGATVACLWDPEAARAAVPPSSLRAEPGITPRPLPVTWR